MTALSVISYLQVSSQLDENAQERLNHEAAIYGMSVMDRLLFAETELKMICSQLKDSSILAVVLNEDLQERYVSLGIVGEDLSMKKALFGTTPRIDMLSDEQVRFLSAGRTIIFSSLIDNEAAIFICRKVQKTTQGLYVFARVRPAYLLGITEEEINLQAVNICIVEGDEIVISSIDSDYHACLLDDLRGKPSVVGGFTWRSDDKEFMASSAVIFLESRFAAPLWTLVMSESKRIVQAPVESFKTIYVLVCIGAIFVVVLLSVNQIRTSLVPLERLMEGTQMISKGDFTSRIDLKSNDEFEELADSFNTMTERLDRQFRALETMENIDRAILSVLDTEKIIDTFIFRVEDLLKCDAAGVCMLDPYAENTWNCYKRDLSRDSKKRLDIISMSEEELSLLHKRSEYIIVEDDIPAFLKGLFNTEKGSFVIMPVCINQRLSAATIFFNRVSIGFNDDFITHARQITDRMAVALSNAHLMEELNQLNWGTLIALARVVDAKSHWTAGHSERVAAMSVRIGKAMGMTGEQIDLLNMAGMLHDIGKISTPKEILDKPDGLTAEEFSIIQEHPEKGIRILEPIAPFAEILPVVLQHHERFDGKGYPQGIKGKEISLCARIMAVADTYDAMISDRPYRRGMKMEDVIREIKKESGSQFDPKVVQAFFRIVAEETFKEKCS